VVFSYLKMSDVMPVGWKIPGAGSGIEFDENDIMFSQQYVDSLLMPLNFYWTLKLENGDVVLRFEDPTNNPWTDDLSRFIEINTNKRFVLSKPTMRTYVVSVLSWKFLPNNRGLGSIVFYGSPNGKKIAIYCGDNIKNTKANPSTQVWEILNDSNLPKGLQVGIDMFSAIELEEAKKNVDETFFNLKSFAKQYNDDNFKPWMEPQCSHLNDEDSHATYVFNISKTYSALYGNEFPLSPGKKWEVLDSDAHNGEKAILVLEDGADNRETECFQSHPEFETTTHV
jgi:hypothetical protein